MNRPPYTRRQFIQITAAGLGSAPLLLSCGDPNRQWRFFTNEEAALVEAIAEQIIPADEDPGATDAGVLNFIDRQLVGPYKRFQPAYRAGLPGVQQTSRLRFGGPFASLSWEQQTQVLELLEAGEAPGEAWDTASSSTFFRMVLAHTMQGFYGPPRHGGNRNYMSYKMIGLDYPQIIGRNRH